MEKKHTQLPWAISEKNKTSIVAGGTSIASVWFTKDLDNIQVRLEGESWLDMYSRTKEERNFYTKVQPEANAEFIVEACNNYERLQSENEMMRELLKEIELEMKFTQGYNPLMEQIQTLLNPK